MVTAHPDLPDWRKSLSRCISVQAGLAPYAQPSPNPGCHWAQLSTIRCGVECGGGENLVGRPACRTVSLRMLTPERVLSKQTSDGELFGFISDTRSAKLADLKGNPFVELLLFFPSTMTQFRCSGTIRVVGGGREWAGEDPDDEAEADAFWNMLSAKERQFFAWPHPGEDREFSVGTDEDKQVFDVEASKCLRRPEHFVYCRLQPDFVESLDLSTFPLVRRFNLLSQEEPSGWSCKTVNP